MSNLGWMADGLERALACGGVPLELYRRPGFTGTTAVRRSDFSGGYGAGFEIASDPAPWDEDEDRHGGGGSA